VSTDAEMSKGGRVEAVEQADGLALGGDMGMNCPV